MNTGAYTFLPVDQLPDQEDLPDPFLGPDGRRIESREAWLTQREYLKTTLAHYMYGHMPPRPEPDEVEIRQTFSRPVPEGGGIQEGYTLTLRRGGRSLDLDVGLFRPPDRVKRPAIIKNCSVLFETESELDKRLEAVRCDLWAAREAVGRGYVFCKFRRTQLAPDEPDSRDRGVYPLYPECDWGAIAVWAWGHQVVLDFLDRLGYADMDRTVCTGHSRGGQAAIAAGVFDERIAVVVPCTGGYGSCGTLRIRDPDGVRGTMAYIDMLREKVPHWHCPRYHEFAHRLNKLPFDAHTLVALVAPRPLLNTNATEDPYNNTLSIEAGIRVGGRMYEWMERADRCRLHWRPGGHGQTVVDWRALLDFSDEVFYGRKGESLFDRWVCPELDPPIRWTAPGPACYEDPT